MPKPFVPILWIGSEFTSDGEKKRPAPEGPAASDNLISSTETRLASLSARAASLLKFLKNLIQIETARLLTWRKFGKGLQMFADEADRWQQHECMVHSPSAIVPSLVVGSLERISAKTEQLRKSQRHRRILPNVEPVCSLFHEHDLPPVVSQVGQAAIIGPVEKFVSWRGFNVATEIRDQVVPIKMDFELSAIRFVSFEQLFFDVGFTRSSQQCLEHVFVRTNAVVNRPRLDHARPADHAGDAVATFPIRVFLIAEWRAATVWP